MVEITNQILCITNNHSYKELLREITSSQENISILFTSNILEAIPSLQSKQFLIVIIDESISLNNPEAFKQLLTLLTSLCINLNTLIIVPQLSNEYFDKYIKLGFVYIADIQIVKYLLPAILKNIKEFKFQRPLPEKIYYKGLSIYPESKSIIFKSCKISITDREMLILQFMINHKGYCDRCTMQKYLGSVFGKPISQSYVSVNMCRLSKKIMNATGLKIIRNRYGIGYYLVL